MIAKYIYLFEIAHELQHLYTRKTHNFFQTKFFTDLECFRITKQTTFPQTSFVSFRARIQVA